MVHYLCSEQRFIIYVATIQKTQKSNQSALDKGF